MASFIDFETPTTEFDKTAPDRSAIKFAFDRVAAFFLLALLLPFLVVVAIMIKLDSPGPVLFTQIRNGRQGRNFKIYKFRTMTAAASRAPFLQATANDERVTAVGRLLRMTDIDELPQLLNVVAGDMSLIGPRPHPPALDERFSKSIPNYMARYAARPGMTGLAQVSGCRGPTPTVQSMAARVFCDIAYISGWSLWSDIKILARTVLVVAWGKR